MTIKNTTIINMITVMIIMAMTTVITMVTITTVMITTVTTTTVMITATPTPMAQIYLKVETSMSTLHSYTLWAIC